MLNFWCEVAGLQAGDVTRVAAGLTGVSAAAGEGARPLPPVRS